MSPHRNSVICGSDAAIWVFGIAIPEADDVKFKISAAANSGKNKLIRDGFPRKKQKIPAKSGTGSRTIHLLDIYCHERLGGLIKSYSRRAA